MIFNFKDLVFLILVILHMFVVDINIFGTAYVQVYNTQSCTCTVLAKLV